MYKFTILMFAGILTQFVCPGQDKVAVSKKIAEFTKMIREARSDSTRAYCMVELAAEYLSLPFSDLYRLDSAELLIKASMRISRRIGYTALAGDQHYYLTRIYLGKNDVSAAIALLSSMKDTNRLYQLKELGQYYLMKPDEEKKDMDSAMLFLLEFKAIADSLQYDNTPMEALRDLARVSFESGNARQGRSYFLQLMKLCEGKGDLRNQAEMLDYMGLYVSNYADSVFPEKYKCIRLAIAKYKTLKDTVAEALSYKHLGELYLHQGDLPLADSMLLESLALYRSIHYPDLYHTYFVLASVSRTRGDLHKSLEYALLTIKNMEAAHEVQDAGFFYSLVGDIYRDLQQPAISIDYYTRAIEGLRKAFNLIDYEVMGHIVEQMIGLGRAREAMDLVQNTNRKYGVYDEEERRHLNKDLADCYAALEEYDQAERHYLEVIEMDRKQFFTKDRVTDGYLAISRFYSKRRQFGKAVTYLSQLLMLPPGIIALSDQADIQAMLSRADSASGNFAGSLKHFQQYKMLNDSIFNIARNKSIQEMEAAFESGKKEQDIRILRGQGLIQQKDIASARQQRNFILAAIVMLLGILTLLFNRYRLKQRSNRILEAQQKEISQKNLRLEHLVDEKEWLLKEIHHRVKNNLQVIISLLNTQSAYINNEAALQAIQESRHRMQAMSFIHQKLYSDEHITVIDMQGYVRELVDYLAESFNIRSRVRFEIILDPIQLDVGQAIPVALMLNETITNALKHA